MTIIPQDAQRLLVGTQPIDPTLEHTCNQSGWIMHFRNRAEQAERQLVIQTERANDLEVRIDALREIKNNAESEVRRLEAELHTAYHCIELSQSQLNEQIYERQKSEYMLRIEGGTLQLAWDEIADLGQGINDLAERCREAEQLLEIASAEADGQQQRAEHLARELNQAKEHTEIYREQADTLQRCFEVAWQERKQWYDEALRAQAEAIEQAKKAASFRKRLEAWVDLSQELEPFKDRAEADCFMLLEATKRQLAGEIE
jgi:chromosome segregation ATPase